MSSTREPAADIINWKDAQGKTALHKAAESKDLHQISNIILSGANIDAEDIFNQTPLHVAAACNHGESHFSTIELLLKNEALVTAQDINKNTPLHHSVERGNIESARLLILKFNPSIYMKNHKGETPVFIAIRNNNFEMVKLLVESDKNKIIVKSEDRSTALHHACLHCDDTKIVRLLLKSGNYASVYAKNKAGNTALFEAIRRGKTEIVRLLVIYGADVNFINPKDGSTPLHFACRYCTDDAKIIILLLKNGADINAEDDKGERVITLLHRLTARRAEILMFLLKYTDLDEIAADLRRVLVIYRRTNDWKLVMEHFAKVRVLELPMSSEITQMISAERMFEEYFERCTIELVRAKSGKIKNTWITYFSLLVDDGRKLKNYANNQDLIKDFERNDWSSEFPIYGEKMRKKVNSAMKKREAYDKSAELLSDCLPIFKPGHLIIRDVLDYLINTRNFGIFCE